MRYALGLFSVIPVPPFDVDRTAASRAMAWFPWLGLLLGALAGAVLYGASVLAGPLLGAMLGLAVLAALTGALHLDGVADTADGLGSRRGPEEALRIMRRSDVGPMGVAVLVLVLLIDAAALASMPRPLVGAVALAVGAMVGRGAVMLASTSRRSAREEGFGALFVGVTGVPTAALSAVAIALAALGGAWWAGGASALLGMAIALAVAAAVGWWWARHLVRRLGGWTGDTFGSLIEITQCVFLVVAALAFG